MKVLFDEKANVTPFATVELGLPVSPTRSSDSDGSSDRDDEMEGGNRDYWSNEELTFVSAAQSQMIS